MDEEPMTSDEIQRADLDAIERELGPVGMIRFLQQYETGQGDYTRERHQWLGHPDVQTLAEKIQQQRETEAS